MVKISVYLNRHVFVMIFTTTDDSAVYHIFSGPLRSLSPFGDFFLRNHMRFTDEAR